MSSRMVVGVDIGTSSVKSGVYNEDGVAVGLASEPVALDRGADGSVTQDLDALHAAAATATARAVAAARVDPAQVEAIAFGGQMAGVGLVDRDHRPVAPYDSWLDTRCAVVLDGLSDALRARVRDSAGCAPTMSIGPKLAWWARTHPDVTERAHRWVTAAGYVAGRAAGLSGDDAFVDPTYLHFTAVTDTRAGTWDYALAQELGVPERLLPRIVPSTSTVGSLTADAAAQFGLNAGTAVVAGCGDTAAAAVGIGVTANAVAFDVAGTAAVLGVHLPEFIPDPSGTLLTMRSPVNDGAFALAYVGGAGELVDWVCTALLGHSSADAQAYADLAHALETTAPGANGLLASPHLSGRVCPPAPQMRGAFVGLTPAHDRRHFARAALEAIALEYRGFAAAALARSAHPLDAVVGVGGGTALEPWNQIKADALGAPYRTARGVDAGTRGAAQVAWAGLGVEPPALDSESLGAELTPHPAAQAAYEALDPEYRRWTHQLAQTYARLGPEESQDERKTAP
jgi:xylulokinase